MNLSRFQILDPERDDHFAGGYDDKENFNASTITEPEIESRECEKLVADIHATQDVAPPTSPAQTTAAALFPASNSAGTSQAPRKAGGAASTTAAPLLGDLCPACYARKAWNLKRQVWACGCEVAQ